MMIKKLFLALNIFLGVVLILVGIGAIRSLSRRAIDIPGEAVDMGETTALIPPRPEKPLSHYLIIGHRKLFGALPSPDFEADLAPLPLETLPRTELRLRLKGTISGRPSLARAIIKDLSTGRERFYRIGEMVAGAKIVGIERNQVVIEREGLKEILVVYKGDLLARREPEKVPLHAHLRPVEPLPVEPREMVLGEEEMAAATEAKDKIVRKLRLDLQNLPEAPSNLIEAISMANRILTRARIKPHFVGGRLEGFRAAKVQPGSIYARLGLRTGDIIKEVNGYRINSLRDAWRIFKGLPQRSVVTVNIKRGGQPVTLVYEIK